MLTEDELAGIRPALLAEAPIAIALIDRERRVRYVNRVEHGYDRSKVQDLKLDALLPAVIHNGRLDPGVRLLEKPFTTSKLAQAVHLALSGR